MKRLKICKTRYPLLMVHGVFFRDFKQGFLNYWGRIPGELTANGATIYYGMQQSAASVEECGRELADRIRRIIRETGCEKVNIIAHSKGGLDARYAISKCGISHGDMIDLNKENFEGFDVREFYVQLVSDLRQMGM